VRNEGGNLSTFVGVFNFVIRCVLQIFVTPSQGLCFDHVFNKTYQYVYNDINVCIGFLRNQFEDHTIRHTKNNDMDYEIRQMLE